MKSVVYLLLLKESQSIKQVSNSKDILDDIAQGHNEFTHMAVKESKQEEPIENIGITSDLKGEHISDELDDGSSSYTTLMEKKNELTSDIRKAGISGQDQEFMDSFSEALTDK